MLRWLGDDAATRGWEVGGADALVARRKLKRQLSAWRLISLLLVLAIVGAIAARNTSLLDLEGHVARLTVNGVIVEIGRAHV